MKLVKGILIAVIVLALALAIAAPIGPLPGFFIGGTPAAAPAQWPDTAEVHEIKLRVPGALPRVVIIWVIQNDGELYVVGAPESGWVTMIGDGSPVEMRLGEYTYALEAQPVSEGWEPILTGYVDKYRPDYPEIVGEFPPLEEAEGQFAIFQLVRS